MAALAAVSVVGGVYHVLFSRLSSHRGGDSRRGARRDRRLPRAEVLQAVADCRKLSEDAPRLACYDKAVAALDQAESKGQVVVIDREQAKTVRRQAFGLTLPAFTLFNKGVAKDEQVDRVSITLEKAYLEGGRHWVFISNEGVVWVQTDDEPIPNEPHGGSIVAIRKAALGSFFCNVDGQRAVRCERRR